MVLVMAARTETRRTRRRCVIFAACAFATALLCSAPSPAQQQAPVLLSLSRGTITYTVVHKLHEVKGTSHTLQGAAKVQPGAPTVVQVRVPIASFDSGNSNRDEHMREATHEPAHPNVELKGTLPPVSLPLSGEQQVTMNGTLEMNGIVQRQSVPVTLIPQGSGVEAKFSFPISLDSYRIERPELLLIKIDDKCVIDGDLIFAERK
jgi:polyisoprenoid-binding protein YceI